MRYLLIGLIVVYQRVFSLSRGVIPRLIGRTRETCVFYPSCSDYGKEALLSHGSIKGTILTVWRVLRCHPFQTPRVDMVPSDWRLPFKKKLR